MFDTMSRAQATRRRIIESTRRLLEDAQGAPISMRQVAEAAGVTRQLLYVHFDRRAHLLLEVSRDADAAARTPQRQARVDTAVDGLSALREAVALQGHIKPRIHAIAQAVDRLRHTDPDAATVWREREQERLDRCAAVVARLAEEGRLRAEWKAPTATRLLWSVTSLRAWEELVIDQGWSTRSWVDHTTHLLERALAVTD
jgi:AcrR family transcriptional regulator